MKKALVGVLAAVLVTFGLVGIGGGAPAAAVECPYTGCVRTVTKIKVPDRVVRGSIVPIKVRVLPTSGTVQPKGRIKAACKHRRSDVVKDKVRRYKREPRFVFFKLGRRGNWDCTVKFRSRYKFKGSSDSETVRVTRR